MLGAKHSRRKRVLIIVVEDWYRPVRDRRAVIVLVVDKMNRGSTELCTGRQHRAMYSSTEHPGAAKYRQRTGVDIHDPSRESARNVRRHELQVSREHKEIDGMFVE